MTCRLAVLASGAGSNLQALIDAITAGILDAVIVGVFSDRAGCLALERARAAGLPATALSPRAFPSREAFDAAFFAAVDAARPDLIVCAGYMRVIAPAEVQARRGRMINLHPSLLPAFKGLHTHRRALEAGAVDHGCSVHVVTAGLDDGPVLAQTRVPVLPGDSEDTLAARVRGQEHALLVAVVGLIATGQLRMDGDRVWMNAGILHAPLQLTAKRPAA